MEQQKRKKVTLVLDVLEEEDLDNGGIVTSLTHPKLEGSLSFVHSPKGGREEFLKALDENIFGSVLDAAFAIKSLVDSSKKAS